MSATVVSSSQLFANLVERMTSAFLDLFLIIALALFIESNLPVPLLGGIEIAGIALIYMAGFWASPLHATPAQFLLRHRVVDVYGRPLPLWRASLRALLVLLVFVCWFSLLGNPVSGVRATLTLAAAAALLLAALMPRRQAAHDLIAGSVVIRAKALRDAELNARLVESGPKGAVRLIRSRWRRLGDLTQALILIGGTTFALHLMAMVTYERGLRTRTSYAIGQAVSLQEPISVFYLENGRLPRDADEAGVAARTRYPDGGYFEMEPGGVIRIRFEKLPELVAGSIALSPIATDGELEWLCRADGDIRDSHLPAICRDR